MSIKFRNLVIVTSMLELLRHSELEINQTEKQTKALLIEPDLLSRERIVLFRWVNSRVL